MTGSSVSSGFRPLRQLCLPISAAFVAGCSGGGGGEASATTVPSQVVVSGTVTFDRVPVAPGVGLEYDSIVQEPARGVTVQAVSGEEVLSSTTTDSSGAYSLPVDANTAGVRIHARAEMLRGGAPGWDFRVVDNTSSNALYVLESPEFATAATNQSRNLHAGSGWDGTSYAAPRAAAPFAILDVVYDAAQVAVGAAPATVFPPLVLHWSPDNQPSRDTSGALNVATGEIGSSLYAPGLGIFLLGAEDSDTDEYDQHVIAHEWAHYFEHALSRSDSIGGPHTRGDQLDMRTAFSEGFANAFSAMATGNIIYTDALGPQQGPGFSFSIEGPFFPARNDLVNPHPGWFSEESIQELVYDLYDDVQDIPEDTVALGLGPIVAVMTSRMRSTDALTSIFPFIEALKALRPAEADQIDALVAVHDIDPIVDVFGSGETNAGTPLDAAGSTDDDVLPIYKPIEVNGGPVNVCSVDAYNYAGDTGASNKLGAHVFLRFTVAVPGTHTMTAIATDVPAGQSADPDMRLHRRGLVAESEAAPDEVLCTAATPEGCAESFSRSLLAGEHILEVYEWTNTEPDDSEYPPIGRTCFDVTVTRP